MLLRRFYHDGLAQASYLVGCQVTGEALVVDPNRRIEQYVEAAAREGLRITAVTETHIHADFVSGLRELAERTGARPYLSNAGPAAWQYAFAADAGATLVADGDTIRAGNVRLDVLFTPGHTPEHIGFLVTDEASADRPMGIFSGDFVFVGDVGRPDLLERAAGVGGTMEESARQLFRSLQRFRELPDYLQVWPGHGAGSACGKALGAVPQSTVGYERLFNWALQIHEEEEFARQVLAGQPEPPRYFAQMKRVNKEGPAKRPCAPLRRLDAADLDRRLAEGGIVVDVRPADDFAVGHVAGTINMPSGGSFLAWAGWLLPYDRPIGLIAPDGEADRVREELQLIGLDRVEGYWPAHIVEDAPAAASFERRTAAELAPRLAEDGLVLLDVRRPEEHEGGHLAGSLNIPLSQLRQRLGELPPGRQVLVYCAGGGRSPIAASILQAHGWSEVVEMRDGFDGWKAQRSSA